MSDTNKFKRAALVLLIITGLVILWFFFQQGRGLYNIITLGFDLFGGEGALFGVYFAIAFVSVPMMLASLIIGFSLLHSIRRKESPFTKKNVTKLKAVAILLVAFELYLIISQIIIHRYFFIFAHSGYSYFMSVSLGGVVIVLGLVVYCIALVFEYGISLQNQVDETL